MVTIEGSLIVLAVSLLVGGLAIYLGAMFALKSRGYTHAVVTAALGSIAWWVLGLVLTELGVTSSAVGSLAGLVVWVWVLKQRYETGWVRAAAIGLFAWVAALVVLGTLATVGVAGIEPYGVP